VKGCRIGRLDSEAPEDPSSDDPTVRARFVGVGGEGFVGLEMFIALDRMAEFAAHGAKLGNT